MDATKITAKEELRKIRMLKHTFVGNREQLHKEIDRISDRVK